MVILGISYVAWFLIEDTPGNKRDYTLTASKPRHSLGTLLEVHLESSPALVSTCFFLFIRSGAVVLT